MTNFNTLINEMDDELFDTLGGQMTLLDPMGGPCPVMATLDLDLQKIIDGQVQYLGPAIVIKRPPAGLNLTGYTVHQNGCTYTLRERISSDGYIAEWAVTAEQGPR